MKLITKLAVSFGVSLWTGTMVVAAPTLPTIQEIRPSVTAEIKLSNDSESKPATPPVKDQEIQLKIEKIASCETSHNPTLVNWNDGGSPSFGLLQFKLDTLLWRSRELLADRVFTAEQNQQTVNMVAELKTISYGSKLPMDLAVRLANIEVKIAEGILEKNPANIREWTTCARKHGFLPSPSV